MKTTATTPRAFRGLTVIALALAALGLSQPAAQAAAITWGSAQDDTDLASDVRVNGTFVDAATTYHNRVGSEDVTLNGVTFQHYSSYTGTGPYSLTFGTSGISMTYSQYNLDFSQNDGATAYQKLRHNSMYAGGSTGGTITLSNLTSGNIYQVQVWAPDWNGTKKSNLTVRSPSRRGTIMHHNLASMP